MVSKRRLPPANGNGHVAPAVIPKLKKGDRVNRLGGAPRGVVRQVKRGAALVWWGTADSKEFVEWVSFIELELETERVVSPDEVIKRQAMGSGG
jgi:hypothetical protein